MRIVTNGQEKYAIAKYWGPFTQYFDLQTPGYWWFKNSRFYRHCWGNKEIVLQEYGFLNPKKAQGFNQ